MFYTAGWGAILGVGGTVAGVVITQAANSALSWRTSRKERKARITDAVTELIASGNSWVYTTCAQENDLFHAIETHVPNEKLTETLVTARAACYDAQLAFGRAIARVRLTCPQKIVDAAEDYHEAIQDFEKESREKGSLAIRLNSVAGIEGTTPDGIVHPQSQLVKITRKAI